MNPYMIKGAKASATTIERLMTLIPATRWDERIHEDRFTPREVVAHMADWEAIFFERILKGTQVVGYVIQPHDESERAAALKYHEQDVPGAMKRFIAARARTLEFAAELTPQQLRIEVTHPELGTLTVSDLVNMLTGHDAYHIDQLTEYLVESAVGTW